MPVFKINNSKLSEVKNVSFSLEKELQDITEKNLDNIFNLEFVSSEFKLNNFRVDTVAFDREINSFVIIEYKKDRNYSVIDQGYSYLSLMLNNKADFVLEYNEKTNHSLKKKKDIDWSQSKVLFISSVFTSYQRNAIGFKDLPIEIWEVKKYDNGTIFYNQLKPLGINRDTSHFLKYGLRTEKGQAKEDNFLYSLPSFIFLSIQFSPTLPSSRIILSALLQNAENSIPGFVDLEW